MGTPAVRYRGCVLVTGAAGAIGSNLTRALSQAGCADVVALDDLSQGAPWSVPERSNVRFLRGSVLDDRSLDEAFEHRPRVVFHLAALFANQRSIDDPERDLLVNGLGTLKVLERARRTGAERVVFAATSAAVADARDDSLGDDEPPSSVATPYQITKGLGERYCQYFTAFHGVPTVRARIFNSYGPGELPGRYRNVIPNFFYTAMRQLPLRVFGTGLETRDFTYVEDVVEGLLRMGSTRQADGQAINLGSGQETPIVELAREINRLTGNPCGIVFAERRVWDGQLRRRASTAKARRLLDYQPGTSLEEGLQATACWFKVHWHQIGEAVRE